MYKAGKIVFLFGYLTINDTVSSSTVLASIPQGFRPKREVYVTAQLFGGGSNDGISNFLRVKTTGGIVQDYNTSMTIKNVVMIGSWYTEE